MEYRDVLPLNNHNAFCANPKFMWFNLLFLPPPTSAFPPHSTQPMGLIAQDLSLLTLSVVRLQRYLLFLPLVLLSSTALLPFSYCSYFPLTCMCKVTYSSSHCGQGMLGFFLTNFRFLWIHQFKASPFCSPVWFWILPKLLIFFLFCTV